MKKNKNTFRISLQFFGEEASPSSQTAGLASPEATTAISNSAPNSGDSPSADNSISAEQEFESLIKGGKFEDAFKKRTQAIIDKRFKNLKAMEEAQAKQQPVINFLANAYGLDPADTPLLLQTMQNDARFSAANSSRASERKASDSNAKNESVAESRNLDLRESFISQKAKELSLRWAEESKQIKAAFPSFDLNREMQNPAFASMLKSGMPMRKAFTAAHSDELIRSAVEGTARKVKEQTLKSIRANGSRVAENGLASGAAITHKTDVNSLSGKDIRSIIKQVENGSKVRF